MNIFCSTTGSAMAKKKMESFTGTSKSNQAAQRAGWSSTDNVGRSYSEPVGRSSTETVGKSSTEIIGRSSTE